MNDTSETPKVDAGDTPVQVSAEGLPVLDCLDTKAGLLSMGGKVSGYRRLLRLMVEQHADDLGAIRLALAGGQREEGRRLAHSLKGAAAILGAEPLRVAAYAVESFLKNNVDGTPDLDELAVRQDELLTGLRAYFVATASSDVPATPRVDMDSQAVLARLLAALEVDDVRAGTLWYENATGLRQLLGQRAEGVGQAISRYDFATARRLLREENS